MSGNDPVSRLTQQTAYRARDHRVLAFAPGDDVTLPARVSADGSVLYGSLVWRDSWSSLSDIPYGVYSFSTSGLVPKMEFSTGHGALTGVCVDGVYYEVTRIVDSYNEIRDLHITAYDVDTGDVRNVVEIESPRYSKLPLQMACDDATGVVYALTYSDDNKSNLLATIDLATGQMSSIGVLGTVNESPSYLTFSVIDGKIYSVATDGNLYRIDPSTVSSSLVGATGYTPQYLQSAAYDSTTGTLWWAASLADGSAMLAKVNIATGAAEKVGAFADGEEYIGLYVKSESGNPEAPAKVTGVRFTPAADGATSGTLAFTLPAATNAGTPLMGDLMAEVTVDDVTVATVNGAPGATLSAPLTMTEGTHTIAVTASQGNLTSTPAPITIWVGKDVPAPVTDVKLAVDGDNMTLTWTAPTAGQHGGYCDMSGLRYRLRRSDGSVVAKAHEATSYTEPLPDVIADYTFTVTPYLEGGADGISTISNELHAGRYYEIPAVWDFNNDRIFESDFKIIDNNGDGSTWGCSYTWDENVAAATYTCSWSNAADDYLVMPGIKVSKGMVYEVEFDHAVSMYDTEKVKILAGKGRTVADLTKVVADFPDLSRMDVRQSARFVADEDGILYLAFYIYSDAGQSYFTIDNVTVKAIGKSATPAKPAMSLKAVATGDGDKVEIAVTAPSSSIGGGELAHLNDVKIYRGDDIANPISTFTSVAPGQQLAYTDPTPGAGPVRYTVVASNSEGEGEPFEAEVFVGGLVPPYSVTFSTPGATEYFTIVNANGDDKTWTLLNGAMTYEYNMFENADDWLFSPNLRLSPDRVYEVTVTARTDSHAESLAVTCGEGVDPAVHSAILDLPSFTYAEASAPCRTYLKVPAAGIYNVGLHAYSKKNRLRIYIDGLTVDDVASAEAPDAATDLTVTADASGLLKATVAFNAPKVACSGATLSSLAKVEVYRGTETTPAKIFTSAAAGEHLEWTDEAAGHGMMTYRVVAYNGEGAGLVARAEAFVGLDTPAAVTTLNAKGDSWNTNAIVSWTAPRRGVNGGYINTDDVTYTVTRVDNWTPTVVAQGLTELTFTDNLEAEGAQRSVSYRVVAANLYGTGPETEVKVSLGQLKSYPYAQFFTGYLDNEWPYETPTNNGSWMIVSGQDGITSVDDGTGFLQYQKWTDDSDLSRAVLNSPKVAMTGAVNPYISLYFYHIPDADERMHMSVGYRVNDGEVVILDDLKVKNGTDSGWKEYAWPLEAEAGDMVSVVLVSECYEYNSRIFVDNLTLDDRFDHNLAIDGFGGNEEIDRAGATYSVTVRNKGLENADAYDVVLLCDGAEVARAHEGQFASRDVRVTEFSVDYPAATEGGKTVVYQARVDYAPDMKTSDNLSDEFPVLIITSDYPGIRDLTAANGDGGVTLAWGKPDTKYSPQHTESFEDFTPFAIEGLDPWTLHDGDGQRTIGIRYGLTFTDWYTPKAWQVWDPVRVALMGEDVAPHSGNLCVISMMSDGSIPGDDDYHTPVNDDWIISDEVAGGSVVTFWLMQPVNTYGGNEAVEVLYSDNSDYVDDFRLLATFELEDRATWHRFQVTLPEDAAYFAIRHHQSFFGLWLDDITYSPVSGARDLSIEGYNVYRDDELIAISPSASYVDMAALPGVHRYAVAAKFDAGEGPLSNVVELDTTPSGLGVTDVGVTCSIWSGDGCITVAGAHNTRVDVSTPDGRLLRSVVVTGSARIPVAPGLYVVRSGDTVRKVKVD